MEGGTTAPPLWKHCRCQACFLLSPIAHSCWLLSFVAVHRSSVDRRCHLLVPRILYLIVNQTPPIGVTSSSVHSQPIQTQPGDPFSWSFVETDEWRGTSPPLSFTTLRGYVKSLWLEQDLPIHVFHYQGLFVKDRHLLDSLGSTTWTGGLLGFNLWTTDQGWMKKYWTHFAVDLLGRHSAIDHCSPHVTGWKTPSSWWATRLR